eukprot:TRINITY_DN2890_c0_g1_i1.p1 TRINITY_DN2890_c0_g1~~TRINITY_DN2890_c0_g1_i1.p1  ORF type:complete len:476 (-),score=111.93 TRINITY_DN2890_c0_g1_i1:29-1456(-)
MAKDLGMDMNQYKRLFSSSRIPQPDCDRIATDPYARHIVVLRNNKIYSFDIVDHSFNPLPDAHIANCLASIIRDAGTAPPAPVDVSVFTTWEREPWAKQRSFLHKYDYVNRVTLEDIDSAIFAMTLESQQPASTLATALECFHGTGRDRWFDKSLHWIIFPDGVAGFNFEHSWGDGHTVGRYVEDIFHDGNKNGAAAAAAGNAAAGNLAVSESGISANGLRGGLRRLEWSLPAGYLSEGGPAREAQKALQALAGATDHVIFKFDKFGRNGLKKCKISPDAFCQMAFQLAYWRMYQKPASTYESCSTINYLAGRTETIRSLTAESVAFVSGFDNPALSAKAKADLLRAAGNAHIQEVKEAQIGRGVDRHLYGLRHMAAQEIFQNSHSGKRPMPGIFLDPAYARSTTWTLSTSNLGTLESLATFGFGAVTEEGYGIGYMTAENSLPMTVSSWGRNTAGYVAQLERALNEMHALLSAN